VFLCYTRSKVGLGLSGVFSLVRMDIWEYDDYQGMDEECPDEVLALLDVAKIKKPEVKIVVEESIVPHVACEIVQAMPKNIIPVLGENKLLRVSYNESRKAKENPSGDLIMAEGDLIVSGKREVLEWAHSNNKVMFRRLVRDHYDEYLELANTLDAVDSLHIWRLMRDITPVKNQVSKNEAVIGAGLSTLSKLRGLYQKTFYTSAVMFGSSNYLHSMSYMPNLRCCVDTDCAESDGFYVQGNLINWRDFVFPGELIVSDCALGGDYEGGLVIPEYYYDIYKDMVRAGHVVIFKGCITDDELYSIPIVDWSTYRPHNMEIFCLTSPGADCLLPREDIMSDMREYNVRRMNCIRGNYFNRVTNAIRVTLEELDSVKLRGVGYKFSGEKCRSTIDKMIKSIKINSSSVWHNNCMDEFYVAPLFDEYLHVGCEPPVVFLDCYFLAKDKERLMASLFKTYNVVYDPDFGWCGESFK